VNGILRSYIRRKDEFAPELLEPHIRYAFSEPVFSLLTEQYGEEAFRIAEALNSPQKLYLRTNTLKTTREGLIKLLRDEGIEAQASDENPEAVSVSGSGIAGGRLFREGYFSIQSLSSMTAVRALRPSPGSRVLDLCAAPGGKTGYMAELMGNNGSITACDIHRHRLELIEAAMKRTGVVIAETAERDSAVFVPEYAESFDFVLADVPCSGLGVIAGKPEIKLSTDPEKYGDLTGVQSRILGNAFSYVRKGGRIEYSTCTLNKNENENVVKDMLSKTGSSARIIEMETLLPYNGKVGFFYSIIEKTAN
jgi:16S rRNA (cytosine967-C5)-methyltransferase